MKFSIIIPVYNVEKYIEKCLMSIVMQSYKDYEIIVIDDGSKDRGGEICDEFAQKYENVKVMHIPNGGVSNARNKGLSVATGEYVWFIDSDDYIVPNALEFIADHVEKYQNLDLFIFDATVVDEQGKQIEMIQCNLPCGEAMKFESQREIVHANTSLWNRIYRTELIKQKGLLFEDGITIAEDLLFNYKYLLECEAIYYERDSLYFYVQRQKSAMSGAGKDKDVQKVFEKLISYYKEQGAYTKYKNEIEYLAVYHYFLVTSIRMVRCGATKEECSLVPKWFKEQSIKIALSSSHIKQMALKHQFLILLLKIRLYKVISILFTKF